MDTGQDWTRIGQNDGVAWFEFAGLTDRRDLGPVRGHLRWLRHHAAPPLPRCHNGKLHRYRHGRRRRGEANHARAANAWLRRLPRHRDLLAPLP